MKTSSLVIACVTLLATTSAHAIDAEYRRLLERSGCTQVTETQGCDIHKTKAENARASGNAKATTGEKAAAALAILGIAALAHHNKHYEKDYEPAGGNETAEFERGYRDGVHGYDYNSNNSTKDYAQGYQAGDKERGNSTAYRQWDAAKEKAPQAAVKGCAKIVAQNFAVDWHQVHIVKSQPEVGSTWLVDAAVGHDHMVCKMTDSGEVLDVRGGERL
jgi:hypothetical protein